MTEPTKSQRREHARELARATREENARRARRRKWLLPTAVTAALVAITAIVTLVIVTSTPAPKSAAGPRNMISGGLQLTGENGKTTPIETAAISATGSPVAPDYPQDDGPAHVVLYIDLSCPACKQFEETYGDGILSLVETGKATYEVQPVAILDTRYAGSRYSTRANNVAACVADLAPDSFLDVIAAMFANQPQEGTIGLRNSEILDVIHATGLTSSAVDTCITEETFAPFVTANTDRASNNPELSGAQGFSTPTLVVDGILWDRSSDPLTFIESAAR